MSDQKKHRSGGRSNTRTRDDIQNIRDMIEQEQPALSPKLIAAVRSAFPQLDKAELTALRTMRGVAAAIPHFSTSRLTGETRTGRTHSYVCSMLNAGYRFTNGRLTTLGSVIVWLLEHPAFTSSAWATKRVEAAIKSGTHQPVPRIPLA